MLAKKTEYLHNSNFFAGVAQLVEHLTCNQGVASSIPAAGTNSKKPLLLRRFFLAHIFPNVYTKHTKNRPLIQAVFMIWCRQRDLNSHEPGSPPPQDGVSTNFTMSAEKLFCGAGTVCRRSGNLGRCRCAMLRRLGLRCRLLHIAEIHAAFTISSGMDITQCQAGRKENHGKQTGHTA